MKDYAAWAAFDQIAAPAQAAYHQAITQAQAAYYQATAVEEGACSMTAIKAEKEATNAN